MALNTDYAKELPRAGESAENYGQRLEKQGARELYLRKALREHFDMSVPDMLEAAAKYPQARQKEIFALRQRFPDLNENRFAWRISKALTLSKEDALVWSQTILATETQE